MLQTIIAEGSGPSTLTGLTSQIDYAQGYGYNIVEIFLMMYGGKFLVAVLSVFIFPLLWVTTSREQKKEDMFSLYGPWAVLSCLVPFFFLFNLNFGPLRFLSYISILGAIFVAALVSYLIIKGRDIKKRVKSWSISIIVIVLLFTLFLSGVVSIYPSPMSYTLSYHNTHSEVLGMTQFIEYRDVSVPKVGLTTEFYRYDQLLLLPEQRSLQKLPEWSDTQRPPWHYGYDRNSSIASSYEVDTYLILLKKDMMYYVDVFPKMAKIRFIPEDFTRVKNDPGANLIYSNGGVDLLTIKGQRNGIVV
jgi:hypothetical protein